MKPWNEKVVEIQPLLQHVMMPESVKYVYDFYVENCMSDILTFIFSHELARKIGLDSDMLVAVSRVKELISGTLVLYQADSYNIGRLIYDDFVRLFVIENEEADFVFLTDVMVIGVPIGYCDLENIEGQTLRFTKIISKGI